MTLAQKLHRNLAPTTYLPLTAEGKRNLPCHPLSEMAISEIEVVMHTTGRGFIETYSEDELCDLFEFLGTRPLARDYDLEMEFPAMLGMDDSGGQGPYKLAYARKGFVFKD